MTSPAQRFVQALKTIVLLVATGCSPTSHQEPSSIPTELVGAWSTITEHGNGFSYEITASGTFVYVGVMHVATLQTTLQETGTVRVDRNQIRFAPDSAILTREDPSTPAENYRRTTTRPPRTMTWSTTGTTLTLIENGEPTTYTRE